AMVGQSHSNALAEELLGQRPCDVEEDRAVPFELEGTERELSELFDQIRLTVHVERAAIGAPGLPVDANRRPRFRLSREVTRLTPAERLFERADAGSLCGRLEDERTELEEFLPSGQRELGEGLG